MMADPDLTRTDLSMAVDQEQRMMVPMLVVVHHGTPAFLHTRVVLAPGQRITLGRGSQALGVGGLEGGRISRRHTEISLRAGTLRARDLDSRNGTLLNGQRIVEAELVAGDVLLVGDVIFVVRWAPGRYEAASAPGWVGTSYPLATALAEAHRAAPLDVSVLIAGETGTGKELVARELHRASGRTGDFVAVNCAALDDNVMASELFGHERGAFSGADARRRGLILAADRGTLFLDEIAEASPTLQASLLRVIQEREVRAVGSDRARSVVTRFVCATHRDLLADVASGRFREDLYARLAQWVVRVPPLRERREDILPLARAAAAEVLHRPIALKRRLALRLLQHDWPRNVRELQSVVGRLAIEQQEADVLDGEPVLEAGTSPAAAAPPAAVAVERPTAEEMEQRLSALGGQVKAYAGECGVSRNTMYRWMKELGVDVDDIRKRLKES
jgi:DNA-binding NtrC family response regulator